MNDLKKIEHLITCVINGIAGDVIDKDIEALAFLFKQREEQVREEKTCAPCPADAVPV